MTHPDRRSFLVQTAGSLAGIALVPEPDLTGPRRLPEPKALGVVGLGRQGRAIIAELQKIDGARVVALCDTNPARVRTGLERAPGAEGFADHRELLGKRRDLDAVIVATPTHLHRATVEAVLSAGKHCYCEAPLAHSVEDAASLAAAVRAASGRIFMAGFQARSNPVYQLARTFYRTDAFRDFVAGRAQYHRKTSWRFPAANPAEDKAVNWRLDPEVSTGLAGELGSQQFDVFHWFRGSMPVSASGSGSIRLHRDGREVPDTVQATLRWADGTLVAYQATLANSYGGQHEVLNGTNAAISLAWSHGWMFKEVDAPTLGWEVYALRQQFHRDEGIILIADATKLAAQGQLKAGIGLPYSPLYYALADFLKSVTFPNVPVPCPLEDGLRATLVGIAANQAVVRQTTVEIPKLGP
jgi:predicted dehydrogenase